MAHLTIFHTSDTHNKLTSEYAARLHKLKEANPGSLMLDSGDAIWSGNMYWRLGGEPVLDLMNGVPYNAMCMGNREYHFWSLGVSSKTSRADFPVLSANLRATRDRQISPTPPHVQFERDGVKIAVFGLSVPCITEKMLVKNISDFYFENPIAAAAELAPQLRSECDILIALTHIGIKEDRQLAEKVDGIDLILGGHTHLLTEEQVGETSIFHHGSYAHYVGRVDIEIESGKITSIKNELIPLAKA
ncbi:MAG: metallophosphatase [Armatimonadetes bacterium]|nr:metallophosphatase [Armatimonadota bacterium]